MSRFLGYASRARSGAPFCYCATRMIVLPPALAVCAIATPWLFAHGWLETGFVLRHAFALVCHQRPERSFWLLGYPLAVCARCFGIYLGAGVGLLLRTRERAALQLFAVALALNMIDCAVENAGLHGDWIDVRMVLGFLLGGSTALVVASVASPWRPAGCANTSDSLR